MDNPSAFPFVLPDGRGGFRGADRGMTLRDWFAGQALTGMGTWVPCPPEGFTTGHQVQPKMQQLKAEWAYQMADAMLATRKAPQND